MSIIIGLDVGTSGTKAIAINERGQVLASALSEYPLRSPKPGWAEQDPADWRKAALEVLTVLAHAPEVAREHIAGLGLTGQMHGSVFLGGGDKVLHNAILWCDQRTDLECQEITNAIGESRLIEMVCNPALTGFTAPKILWLRKHEPRAYEQIRKVLLPKDYIRLCLTGEYATDMADASGTLLLNVKERAWHSEVLSILQIDPDWMPPVYEGPEVTGYINEETAAATGLPKGIPVIAGGGDQAAGGVGNGIVRSGLVSAAVGTSGVVFAHSSDIRLDPEGRVHTFCHSVPGAWHVMGVVLSAGGSLRWHRDVLAPAEAAAAQATGDDPYELITRSAARVDPGSDGLTFLPYLTGERTPHKDPYARGAFIGLSLAHTRAHLHRAVLEGVAYAMRDSFELLAAMGVPIETVRASGGGARSAVWRQIMADIFKHPITRTNVDEGPAYGAALLAMDATGLYATIEEACEATIHDVDVVEPNPEASKRYEDGFAMFQQYYRELAASFRKAATMNV